MLLMHPLDFITLAVIIGVIIGLLWMIYQTYKELTSEDYLAVSYSRQSSNTLDTQATEKVCRGTTQERTSEPFNELLRLSNQSTNGN
jgi:hypothetical protein